MYAPFLAPGKRPVLPGLPRVPLNPHLLGLASRAGLLSVVRRPARPALRRLLRGVPPVVGALAGPGTPTRGRAQPFLQDPTVLSERFAPGCRRLGASSPAPTLVVPFYAVLTPVLSGKKPRPRGVAADPASIRAVRSPAPSTSAAPHSPGTWVSVAADRTPSRSRQRASVKPKLGSGHRWPASEGPPRQSIPFGPLPDSIAHRPGSSYTPVRGRTRPGPQ